MHFYHRKRNYQFSWRHRLAGNWLYSGSNFTDGWSNIASASVPTSTKSAGSSLTSTTTSMSLSTTTSTSSSPDDREEQDDSGVGGKGYVGLPSPPLPMMLSIEKENFFRSGVPLNAIVCELSLLLLPGSVWLACWCWWARSCERRRAWRCICWTGETRLGT